jgi:hypothetical protein
MRCTPECRSRAPRTRPKSGRWCGGIGPPRFLWDMPWGRQDRKMLKKALRLWCQGIEPTGALTLLPDGERRSGSRFLALCRQARRTGTRGRPKKTLPTGVTVRLKHQGAHRHQRGPKRPQYHAPAPAHPDTAPPRATHDMHANHLAAFHTSLRRRCAAYRRRTNR